MNSNSKFDFLSKLLGLDRARQIIIRYVGLGGRSYGVEVEGMTGVVEDVEVGGESGECNESSHNYLVFWSQKSAARFSC